MTICYVGLAQGKVAHIEKPNSLVIVKQKEYAAHSFTLCGRRVQAANWFTSGIDPFGETKPDYLPICKQCAAAWPAEEAK